MGHVGEGVERESVGVVDQAALLVQGEEPHDPGLQRELQVASGCRQVLDVGHHDVLGVGQRRLRVLRRLAVDEQGHVLEQVHAAFHNGDEPRQLGGAVLTRQEVEEMALGVQVGHRVHAVPVHRHLHRQPVHHSQLQQAGHVTTVAQSVGHDVTSLWPTA